MPGVERAIVNVHYLADQIERHLAPRRRPHVVISDERAELLGTGGGIVKALPELGDAPFFLVNSDTVWLDGVKPNLARLAEAFDPDSMDALLLMAPTTDSIGYAGRGDYAMLPDGRLRRRAEREVVPFVYTGAAILTPALFADAPAGAFPLTLLFDRAGEKGRLFGLRLEGVWMHVGTPDAVTATALAERGAPAMGEVGRASLAALSTVTRSPTERWSRERASMGMEPPGCPACSRFRRRRRFCRR